MKPARFPLVAFPALACSVLLASGCGTDTNAVPTQLVLTTQPSPTAHSGAAFPVQPVIQLRDASGNNVSQTGVSVTANNATGSGTLGGTTTVQTNSSGQAVYTDLMITGAGAHTLLFTASGLTPETSTIIDLPEPATQLVITIQPADTALSGVAFARQPVVQLRDAAGNNISQGGVSGAAALATGSGTLGGTTTVQTNSNGQAVYTDLVITGAGAHTLSFTATGLTPGTSSSITLPTPLQYDVPVTALSGAQGSARWFVLQVPAGASQLVASTSGGTGDADLYLRFNALPDTFPSNSDCRSIGETTAERCTVANPSAGPWFMLVYGYTGFSGVSLTVTSQAPCTTPGDTDRDRLADCVETNTGVFVSPLNTGTNPNDADTDNDGLDDGDEVLGTPLGLDLPNMGVSPLRQDILIEYDWFDDALQSDRCSPHSHRPTTTAVAMVTAAFANAPPVNPDGSRGINIIHDYGQGGVYTGGNLIADADGVLDGAVGDPEFLNHKSANFNANRRGYFHYTMLVHYYDTNSLSTGIAERPGDDLIVAMHCPKPDLMLASTIMHELGHNLNLLHGGDTEANFKPNYNSIMNYKYQFPGIDNDCTPPGNGVLDYSIGARPLLVESNLNETRGVCGNPPGPGWDWNGDGDAFDVGLSLDINVDDEGIGDGFLGALHDYNDWAHLLLRGVSDAGGALLVRQEIIRCMAPLPGERR